MLVFYEQVLHGRSKYKDAKCRSKPNINVIENAGSALVKIMGRNR